MDQIERTIHLRKVLHNASGGYITVNLTRVSFLRHKTAPAGTSLIGAFLNVLDSTRINASYGCKPPGKLADKLEIVSGF